MLKNRYIFIWKDDILAILNGEEKAKLKLYKARNKEIIYAQKIKFIVFVAGKAHLKYYSDNNEYILGLVKPQNFIVLDEKTGLEMIEKSEFYELSFKNLLSLCNNEKFAVSVVNALVRNLLSQREMTYDYTFLSIEERILKFLLQAYEFKKPADNIIKVCDITTMAQLLGASRQNVSKAINEHIKNGLLHKIDRNTYDLTNLIKNKRNFKFI